MVASLQLEHWGGHCRGTGGGEAPWAGCFDGWGSGGQHVAATTALLYCRQPAALRYHQYQVPCVLRSPFPCTTACFGWPASSLRCASATCLLALLGGLRQVVGVGAEVAGLDISVTGAAVGDLAFLQIEACIQHRLKTANAHQSCLVATGNRPVCKPPNGWYKPGRQHPSTLCRATHPPIHPTTQPCLALATNQAQAGLACGAVVGGIFAVGAALGALQAGRGRAAG